MITRDEAKNEWCRSSALIRGIDEMMEGGKKISAGDTLDAAAHSKRPTFSVITSVINGERAIEATINSVVGQTYRNFEYIVVDGASTDGTVSILQKYNSQIDYWVSKRDSGIYDAWNRALSLARGEWISFLGAGDVYSSDALEGYAEIMLRLPKDNVQYISSRVQLVNDDEVVKTIGRPWSWPAFSRYMTVAHVGSMHHRSLFDEYGCFNDTYRICGDYEMLLRARSRLPTAFLNQVTVKMVLGGISNANVVLALEEQERAKSTTGGRAPWLCSLERRKAYAISRCRSLIRF